MTHPAVTDWLDRAQALHEKTTPGRWRVWAMKVMAGPLDDSDYDKAIDVAQTFHLNEDGRPRTFDADFIAAAHTDLPRAVAALRAVLAFVDEQWGQQPHGLIPEALHEHTIANRLRRTIDQALTEDPA